MKKAIFYFTVFCILGLINANYAQTIEVENLFWVVVSNNDAEKSNSYGFTNSTSINNLFKNYNVYYYEQALPFAKTPLLKKVYEI